MGQRLNIEIVSNEGTIANAYYHWSAYTGSAIALTEKVVEAYHKYVDVYTDPLELAVRMLEYTGAGINNSEWYRIASDPRLAKLAIQSCTDRNKGLIAVTEAGISETESWEEGRVTVNIEEETILFGVFWEAGSFDEWAEDMWIDEGDSAEDEYAKLPEIDFEFEEIAFEDLHGLMDVYEKSYETFGFKRTDGSVVNWIE